MEWQGQPRQNLFLSQKTFEAFYGGAAGGGKTDALLIFQILRRNKYPGSKGLFLRRTIEELKKEGSAIPRSFELLSGLKDWAYRSQEKKWVNKSGSVLEFGYCKYEKDVYQYQSAQYDDLTFDELTHFTLFQYEYVKTRVRSARGVPVAVRAASNPGNIGHAWVKERFVSICQPETLYVDPDTRESRIFIPAKLTDNKVLMEKDPKYLSRLNALPENERRALRDGDWDVFKGQYFSEWRYDKHVCDPFTIPDHWNRYITMDWGMAKPLACYWIAVDENKRAYVYREFYVTGLISSQAAEAIMQLTEPSEFRFFSHDPSMNAKKGETSESIGEVFRRIVNKRSIRMLPANNDRVNGWMRLREWLSISPDGMPWMKVFSTCSHLIKTLPEQIYDDYKVEDMNSDGEDHACDALRYWAISSPRIAESNKKDETMTSLDMRSRMFWENQEKAKEREKNDNDLITDDVNLIDDISIF